MIGLALISSVTDFTKILPKDRVWMGSRGLYLGGRVPVILAQRGFWVPQPSMVFPNKWEGTMGSIAEDCRFDSDSTVFSCLMLASVSLIFPEALEI